jgi:hypothetical protein
VIEAFISSSDEFDMVGRRGVHAWGSAGLNEISYGASTGIPDIRGIFYYTDLVPRPSSLIMLKYA